MFFLGGACGVLTSQCSRKGEYLLMPTPTNPNDLTMSICLRRELRLQLEQVRLMRGHRAQRMPTLRALIEEAIGALVEKETADGAAPTASRTVP